MENTASNRGLNLGRILVTPPVEQRLEAAEVRTALRRHARGDWGKPRRSRSAKTNAVCARAGASCPFFATGSSIAFVS